MITSTHPGPKAQNPGWKKTANVENYLTSEWTLSLPRANETFPSSFTANESYVSWEKTSLFIKLLQHVLFKILVHWGTSTDMTVGKLISSTVLGLLRLARESPSNENVFTFPCPKVTESLMLRVHWIELLVRKNSFYFFS